MGLCKVGLRVGELWIFSLVVSLFSYVQDLLTLRLTLAVFLDLLTLRLTLAVFLEMCPV